MLIGLVVAAVGINSSVKQETAFSLAVPLAICAIPILDAGAALIRRITTGQSVFTADRGHLHHALLLRGWSVNKTVMIIAGLAAMTCGGALVSHFTNMDAVALAIAFLIVSLLAVGRIFGHAELALIGSRSVRAARKLMSRSIHRPAPEMESAVQLQGRREWQTLWTALREAAPVYNVTGLTFQIAIPHLHESFYASWNCHDTAANGAAWRATLPLVLDNEPIGKLLVVGSATGRQALIDMQQLFDFLESLDSDIARIASEEADPSKTTWLEAAMQPALY